MDRQTVDGYVEQSRQLVEASPGMDEQNTKVRLVQPFLEVLGWEFPSTDVELEYAVPMASGRTRVDYALLVEESPAVFVEAKAVRNDLTEDAVQQLRSYMRQELDVRWGVLTNGATFEVLTRSADCNDGREVSLGRVDLEELPERYGLLELLSRDSIRSGRADETARKIARTSEGLRTVREHEEDLAASVTELVHEEVGELSIDVETQSREFVSELVSTLRERRHSLSEEPAEKPETPTIPEAMDELAEPELAAFQSATSTDDGTGTDVDAGTGGPDRGGYVIEFSDGTVVPGPDDPKHATQRRNMGAAIDHLIDEHGLTDELSLPYAPAERSGRCTINSEPEHPGGAEMKHPYELIDGNHLHTLLGTREKRRLLRTLAGKVGHSVEFLGEWQSSPGDVLEERARS